MYLNERLIDCSISVFALCNNAWGVYGQNYMNVLNKVPAKVGLEIRFTFFILSICVIDIFFSRWKRKSISIGQPP